MQRLHSYWMQRRKLKVKMEESGEEMPLDAEFDGGLKVPGNIFARLFDYQKTGWLLIWQYQNPVHLQQSICDCLITPCPSPSVEFIKQFPMMLKVWICMAKVLLLLLWTLLSSEGQRHWFPGAIGNIATLFPSNITHSRKSNSISSLKSRA